MTYVTFTFSFTFGFNINSRFRLFNIEMRYYFINLFFNYSTVFICTYAFQYIQFTGL